jgi:hypothetical protein
MAGAPTGDIVGPAAIPVLASATWDAGATVVSVTGPAAGHAGEVGTVMAGPVAEKSVAVAPPVVGPAVVGSVVVGSVVVGSVVVLPCRHHHAPPSVWCSGPDRAPTRSTGAASIATGGTAVVGGGTAVVGGGTSTVAGRAGVVGGGTSTVAGRAGVVVDGVAAGAACTSAAVPALVPAARRRVPVTVKRSLARATGEGATEPALKVVVDAEARAGLASNRVFEAIRAWWAA